MGNIQLPFGLTRDHISLEPYTFPYLRKNWPRNDRESPYDPLEGFPNGRKERGMMFLLLLCLIDCCSQDLALIKLLFYI